MFEGDLNVTLKGEQKTIKFIAKVCHMELYYHWFLQTVAFHTCRGSRVRDRMVV